MPAFAHQVVVYGERKGESGWIIAGKENFEPYAEAHANSNYETWLNLARWNRMFRQEGSYQRFFVILYVWSPGEPGWSVARSDYVPNPA